MKKLYLLKTMLLLCALVVGSMNGWAETYTLGWGTASGDEGTYTNFTATSGKVEGIVSFTTDKNGSNTNPAYNSNSKELRLYFVSGGNGGSITLLPVEGVTITGFVMTTSTDPSVKYTVDGGNATSVNNIDNTYSVAGISASTSLKIQNVNTTNTQLRIKTIQITYTVYSINAVSNNNDYGKVSLSGSTITATPEPGYRISSSEPFTVTSGSAEVTQNGNKFSVNASSDCTVQINFEAIQTYTVTWSVNGEESEVEVEEGDPISFEAPTSGIPSGYVFKGWVTEDNKIDTPTDTDPSANYVTSANCTEDITYYAVMAIENGSFKTVSLIGDEIASNFASSAMAYADEENSYNDTNDNMIWAARCLTNKDRHWIQLKNDANTYIKAVAPASITEVKVKISNTQNASGGIDDITKHGAFNGNVKLDNVQSTNTGTFGSANSSAIDDNKCMTIVPISASNTLYIHVDAGARVWNVDVTYGNVTTSGYCTTVPIVDVTITSAEYATFHSEYAVDFSGTGIKVYTATDNTTSVKLTEIESGQVPANTPVVLYKAGGATVNVPVIASAAEVGDNDLRVSTGEYPTNAFVLSKPSGYPVGFYLWDSTKMLNAGKVYLQGAANDGARKFLLFDNQTTTAVESISVNAEESVAYDLQGRRVMQPTKGLYIVNGKKVVIK